MFRQCTRDSHCEIGPASVGGIPQPDLPLLSNGDTISPTSQASSFCPQTSQHGCHAPVSRNPKGASSEKSRLRECAHSGEKPFHCQHCQARFVNLAISTKHDRQFQSRNPEISARQDAFLKHVLTVHNRVSSGEPIVKGN